MPWEATNEFSTPAITNSDSTSHSSRFTRVNPFIHVEFDLGRAMLMSVLAFIPFSPAWCQRRLRASAHPPPGQRRHSLYRNNALGTLGSPNQHQLNELQGRSRRRPSGENRPLDLHPRKKLKIAGCHSRPEAKVLYCPECETSLDVQEDEVDEGEVLSCPECGLDFEVATINPVELKAVEEEYEDDDEEEEETADGDDS